MPAETPLLAQTDDDWRRKPNGNNGRGSADDCDLSNLKIKVRALVEVNSRPVGEQIVVDPLRFAVIGELGYGFDHGNCWGLLPPRHKSCAGGDGDGRRCEPDPSLGGRGFVTT